MVIKRLPSTMSLGLALSLSLVTAEVAVSQSRPLPLRVTVNSPLDAAIQADEGLTLREAIALVNGTLAVEQLSPTERSQVQTLNGQESSQIAFNLPAGQTAIALRSLLPPLATAGLIIDGTTQPGYDANQSPTAEIAIPQPVVSITAAPGVEVFRGLTVTADGVTVRGLSIYGFGDRFRATTSTPPADILVTPPDTHFPRDGQVRKPVQPVVRSASEITAIPQNVVLENNWLGLAPSAAMPPTTSDFGVYVFNATGTVIRHNRIAYHGGSGVITSAQATGTQIVENIVLGNGLAGLPNAIHLDGKVDKSEIRSNLICANDGSGVFLFKPQGAVQVRDNTIKFNGRRLRQAAVYLMGSDHRVENNQISHQSGPGVVVTAFPNGGALQHGPAARNLIQANRFSHLEGLSIDLNMLNHMGPQEFYTGDGKNPQRESQQRRRDTGNAAINAPVLLAPEFLVLDGRVNVDGMADPGSEVAVYRVGEDGALAEAIATTKTDDKGRFGATLENLQPGQRVSAIATDPQYGTSEPAESSWIVSQAGERFPAATPPVGEMPTCLTPASMPPPPPPAAPSMRLEVPKNVHFALDQDSISPTSARVLDKIATVLRENPAIVVELLGHTDQRASDAYNLDLAARRARNTRNYLIRQGIAAERMTIRAVGERQLLTPGTDKVDHARNRRVEFTFQDVRGIEVIVQETDLQPE